jgi:hypothetical protein
MLGKGRILFDADFTAPHAAIVPNAAGEPMQGSAGVSIIGVNEGSYITSTADPSGVEEVTTDTADNDNHALIAGVFRPSDGPISIEARFRYHHLTCAIYFGLSETMALDTPVMPAEFATVTMTYNGTGGMVGFNYDVDGTTDDWRAVMADGGANTGGTASANGIRANSTPVIDSWIEAKIDLYPDGSADLWLGDSTVEDGQTNPKLRFIKHYESGLDPANFFYAVLMIENRDGSARRLDVDYFRGWSNRSWKVA